MAREFREWVLETETPTWVVDLAANEGGERFINVWRGSLTAEGIRAVDFEFKGRAVASVGLDFASWQPVGRSVDAALQDALAEHRRREKRRAAQDEASQAAGDEMRRRIPGS